MQEKDNLTGLSEQEDMQTRDREEEITEGFELGEHGQKRRLASQASILTKRSSTSGRERREVLNAGLRGHI